MQLNQPIIEVNNVSLGYGSEEILSDIHLNVQQGDFAGIIGPNGSGKTTLLKVILGLAKADHGEVRLFGEELSKFKSWEKIGYVPQKATHFNNRLPITVKEVVSLGFTGKAKGVKLNDKIQEALRVVGMSDHENRLLKELSGGQQQRVFIAKALVSSPELLILDEPTTGVDASSQDQFYELLSNLNANGLTLIMVSHDLDIVVKEVNKLICINKTILYSGPPEEFIESDNIEKLQGKSRKVILHKH
jgi:zinc transport system ATP-binding protein